MAMAALIKESTSLGLDYRFRRLVHSHHGREHGAMQEDMALENSREFYSTGTQRQQEDNGPWAWLGVLKPQSPSPSDRLPPRVLIFFQIVTW